MPKPKKNKKKLARPVSIYLPGSTVKQTIPYLDALKVSEQMMAQHKLQQSRHIIDQLIDIFPKDLLPNLQLLQLHNLLENPGPGALLAAKLLTNFPRELNVYKLAISALRKAGMTEEAVNTALRAAKLFPRNSSIFNHLGLACSEYGDKQAAIEAYNNAILLGSDDLSPYWNRARLDGIVLDTQQVSIMKDKLNDPTLEDTARALLLFSLAWAYEKSDADKHFELLDTANRLVAKSRPWSIDDFEYCANKIISAYTPQLVEQHSSTGFDELSPIIIVGSPRSGTTLIDKIISSHSQVKSLGEAGQFNASLINIEAEMYQGEKHWQWITTNTLPDALDTLHKRFTERIAVFQLETAWFTEKSMTNVMDLGLQLLLYPQAKVIHCLRHPLDICLSNYQLYYESGQHFSYQLEAMAHYYNTHQRLMTHWKDLFPDRIFTLHYEDLVAFQELQSRQLMTSLGLDWEDACLTFYQQKGAAQTASEWQVRKPIYSDAVARWKPFAKHLQPAADILGIDINSP